MIKTLRAYSLFSVDPVANFDRWAWLRSMISSDEFETLLNGHFASVTLENGPAVQGYAARDLEEFQLMRVGGFTLEGDGTVSQFSLRLERSQIKAASVLKEPPAVTDHDGKVHRMRSAFWDDEASGKIDLI